MVEVRSHKSILSVIELMVVRHLSGVKSLLDAANVIVMPQVTKASRAQLATFWNFARCDYLAAFINRTKTRLDTDDLSLWRAAGLQIEEYDEVQSNSRADTSQPSKQSNIREDMLSNKLVWILSKLMNQLATESKEQGDKAATWVSLERELERWFQSLPDTFSPAGRFEPDSKSADPTRSLFAESFYSIPLCAVTMQHYHFAQVMLLLHKPRENSNSVRDQLRRYREIPDRIAYHCKEICAIALGRPPGYVRIHMLQPLFIAGQCLESADERNIILDLLRGIERDLGWATQYRVRELLAEWNWEDDGRWLRYKTR
jgi:hypothetical protein